MAVKLNWIDRAVAAIDPIRGARRLQARQALALFGGGDSYYGADQTRRAVRNWRPKARSADADTVPALADLRAKSRDLARNNAIAGGAVAGVTTAVVGTGLSVQPQILARRLGLSEAAAQAWQQDAKESFELWAARAEWCDQAAKLNFYGLQELAFRSALESGDLFALLPMQRFGGEPFETKVQLIEADRCINPPQQSDFASTEWLGGIRVDANSRPLAAWIADQHPGETFGSKLTGREVAFYGKTGRRNLLHLVPIDRPGQRRGVPYLAPVMEPLRQLGVYTDAEIMAAVVSSMFTIFVKRPAPENPEPSPDGASSSAPVKRGEISGDEIGLESGAVLELGTEEDIVTANPSRPNAAFDPFVQAIFQQIGMRLEIPRDVLMKSFLASYSAARAALLEAWRFYRKRREWLAGQFCQPVYEAVITELVLAGRLNAPGFVRDPLRRAAYLRAVWIGDAPGAIDPLREADAAEKRIAIGISDKAAETVAYSGRNWEDVHAQRVREWRAEERDGLGPVRTPAPPPPPRQGAGGQAAGKTDDTTDEETE
jgi:lambda family phage portal protein